ncbi:hypothetical protein R1flu_003462 [Riccia fluitans]|uniref:Short-chain dehydrogenase/reductase n=1 Tax=Riccia fluitans TaxID=41844 RepID=A0ABD1YC58_9MARC
MALRWFRKENPDGVFGPSSTAEEVTAGVDASGLVAIVTGGTSGLGLETVRVLTLRGARVFLAARNLDSAAKAREEILKQQPNANINLLKVDVSSMSSVRQAAEEFLSLNLPLNLLVNNAGSTTDKFRLTEDGIEEQFATNYLGAFLLTELLLEKMKITAQQSGVEGRIVNVASMVHRDTYKSGIEYDTIKTSQGYNWLASYGQSKLAMILHAKELTRRLREEEANVTINSLHPGAITTNLLRDIAGVFHAISAVYISLWGKDIPQGAATQCYVALNPDVKGVSGEYFDDCKVSQPTAFGRDPELAKKLWDFTLVLLKECEK